MSHDRFHRQDRRVLGTVQIESDPNQKQQDYVEDLERFVSVFGEEAEDDQSKQKLLCADIPAEAEDRGCDPDKDQNIQEAEGRKGFQTVREEKDADKEQKPESGKKQSVSVGVQTEHHQGCVADHQDGKHPCDDDQLGRFIFVCSIFTDSMV